MFARARKHLVRLIYLVVAGIGLLAWAGPDGDTARPREVEVVERPGSGPSSTQELRIATWNIARARGPWWDHSHDSAHRVAVRLAGIQSTMDGVGADVVVLQEADLDSARSARIDQPSWLMDEGRYPYLAAVPSWDLGYLAWPLTRPSDHIGRVKMGHAVLSRHRLRAHRYLPLPQPTEHSRLKNLFWVHRAIQHVVVDFRGQPVHILNLHLESRSLPNRNDQMAQLVQTIRGLDGPVIALGDFNTLPHDALRRHGFTDHADFRADRSMESLRRQLPTFREGLDGRNNAPTATFPSVEPQRRLDFVLYSPHFAAADCDVIKPFEMEVGSQPSDHLPIACTFRVVPPSQ